MDIAWKLGQDHVQRVEFAKSSGRLCDVDQSPMEAFEWPHANRGEALDLVEQGEHEVQCSLKTIGRFLPEAESICLVKVM